jgi:purine catabolism regulator
MATSVRRLKQRPPEQRDVLLPDPTEVWLGPEGTIRFDPAQARVMLNDERMLLLNVQAMGRLRKDLVDNLGADRARGFLTRYGWNCGYHDALALRPSLPPGEHDSLDWVDAGVRLHALEGISRVETVRAEFDRDAGIYDKHVACHNSYEAEQHRRHFGLQSEGACWILAGYASGFSSVYFGAPVYYREVRCAASGDDCCYLIGMTAAQWGNDGADHLHYFKDRPVAQELEAAHSELRLQHDNLQQIVALNDRLASMVLRGEGLEQMVSTLAGELDLDILVEDRLGFPMAASTSERFADRPTQSSLSLVAAGETVGRVRVAARDGRTTPISRVAVQQVTTVCGMAVMRDRVAANVEHRLQSELFERLLVGDTTGIEKVTRFANLEPLINLGNARVMVIEPALEGLRREIGALLDGLAHDALRRWPGCRLAASRGDELLLLVGQGTDSPEAIGDSLADYIGDAAKGSDPRVGIGGLTHDLAGVERSHRQARQALALSRSTADGPRLVAYDECAIEAMLSETTSGDDLVHFSESILQPLSDADDDGSLLATLRAYLAERGRNKDTAERLTVHISTLKYRLRRIETLTGLDLHDGDDFFRAGLAVRILDGDA